MVLESPGHDLRCAGTSRVHQDDHGILTLTVGPGLVLLLLALHPALRIDDEPPIEPLVGDLDGLLEQSTRVVRRADFCRWA